MIGLKATRHGLNGTKLTMGHLWNTEIRCLEIQTKQAIEDRTKTENENYNAAKRKRSKDTAPKWTQVEYDEAIGKINMNKIWIWRTELIPEETLKYQSWEYRKYIPDDQEKLMTRIINRKDSYDKEKEKNDQNEEKNAASTLMEWLSKKRGEQSNKGRHGTKLMTTTIVRQWLNKQTTTLNMTKTV